MHISFVVVSISRAGGGVSEIVRRTAQSLVADKEAEVSIFSLHDSGSAEDITQWRPLYPTLHDTTRPRSLHFAKGLKKSLSDSGTDLCHAHGMWVGVSSTAASWTRDNTKPFMITVHGMLEPWAIRNSRWKKRLAGLLYANRTHRGAQCIQVNTTAELGNVRNYGLKNPVCVIPNGVDVPHDETLAPPRWMRDTSHEGKNMLFLGRFHPKKGMLAMLDGWQCWKRRSGDQQWRLIIAGWDDGGHHREVEEAIQNYQLQQSVSMVGPQFGDEKNSTYAHADAFILSSHSEGLPMAVLEAWANNLPVLMTTPCNLTIGFEREAAIEITTKPDDIACGIDVLTSMSDDQRSAMGLAGKQLVQEQFTWQSVANQLFDVYQWLLHGGPPPDSVVAD